MNMGGMHGREPWRKAVECGWNAKPFPIGIELKGGGERLAGIGIGTFGGGVPVSPYPSAVLEAFHYLHEGG
jgi:hypothetical protein